MEALGIDTKLLIAQLINYALFFLLFMKFVSKPFQNFMDKRKKEDEQREITLKKLQEGEKEMKNQQKKIHDEAKQEADNMIQEAKKDAERVKEGILAETKQESEALLEKTKKQIEEERVQMQEEIKKEAVDLSISIVQKGLSTYLNESVQKQITQNIVSHYKPKVN